MEMLMVILAGFVVAVVCTLYVMHMVCKREFHIRLLWPVHSAFVVLFGFIFLLEFGIKIFPDSRFMSFLNYYPAPVLAFLLILAWLVGLLAKPYKQLLYTRTDGLSATDYTDY